MRMLELLWQPKNIQLLQQQHQQQQQQPQPCNNNNNNNEAVELHWFFFVYAEISDAGRYDVLKLTGGPRLV